MLFWHCNIHGHTGRQPLNDWASEHATMQTTMSFKREPPSDQLKKDEENYGRTKINADVLQTFSYKVVGVVCVQNFLIATADTWNQ